MIHNKIEFLNDTTALSPQVRKTMRQPALISSPVILLMLAACSGNNSASTVAAPVSATSIAGSQGLFASEAGNNTINGTDDVDDEVTYYDDPAGVTVSLEEGTATDGWGGTDTLLDVENVEGSKHGDTITGNGAANHIYGYDGGDILEGGEGTDDLWGNNGKDRFVLDTKGHNISTTVKDFNAGNDTLIVDIANFDNLSESDKGKISDFFDTLNITGVSDPVTLTISGVVNLTVKQVSNDVEITNTAQDATNNFDVINTDIDHLSSYNFEFV